METTDLREATLGYVAPFVVFVGLMGVEHAAGLPPQWLYPLRLVAVSLALILFSRRYLPLRASFPLASIAIGVGVFVVWVAPDILFGYRHHWLFENALTGAAVSTAPSGLQSSLAFRILRTAGCTLLVPVVEELFWRGWLMRWLVDTRFLKVPLGTYAPFAFWVAALLFASEHGPFWEVGLAAGIVYNWWIVRTRNLADCMIAHAVTNGLLSAYVLITGQWQYWL